MGHGKRACRRRNAHEAQAGALPGFTAAFAGCGVLAAVYAVMRRRRE